MSDERQKSRRKTGLLLILIISLTLIIAAVILLVLLKKADTLSKGSEAMHSPLPPDISVSESPDPSDPDGSDPSGVVPAETGEELPDNPIRFDELQSINPDAYAWLSVPMGREDWDISRPILQTSPGTNDDFYLHHNIERKYEYTGELYTEKWNGKDFTDPVTVIYGHNMYDDSTEMFSKLINFQDEDFFNEHEFFYIYTPGHILTYRIAAAIQFDNRHILNSFDFTDEAVFDSWIQNYILNPRTMIRRVREDVTVTTEDHIVILSTCLGRNMSNYRYLVQGVLISDEPTK